MQTNNANNTGMFNTTSNNNNNGNIFSPNAGNNNNNSVFATPQNGMFMAASNNNPAYTTPSGMPQNNRVMSNAVANGGFGGAPSVFGTSPSGGAWGPNPTGPTEMFLNPFTGEACLHLILL